jgi:hypothetical protein
MASEGGFNPIAAIVHLIAIAAGLFGGWAFMGWAAPDLPAEEVEPGISAAAPEAVSGGDPDSLFRASNLGPALDQLAEQVPAGNELISFELRPGEISAESGDGGIELDPEAISATAPEAIVPQIAAPRREAGGDPVPIDLDDVAFFQIVRGRDGPRWYVQLDLDIDPPRTAHASLDGTTVTVP